MNGRMRAILAASGVLAFAAVVGCSGDETKSPLGTRDIGTMADSANDAATSADAGGDVSRSNDGGAAPDLATADVGDNDQDVAMAPTTGLLVIGTSGMQSCVDEPGVTYRVFDNASINANKQVIFNANIMGTGVGPRTDTVVCVADLDGVARAVVREGDATPGIAGETFDLSIWSAQYLDENNRAHVYESFESGMQGLWAEDPNQTLALVAADGEAAPGQAAGVTFNAQSGAVGDGSDSVFRWALEGPGISAENNSGFWRGQPGSVSLLLSKGDPTPGLADATFAELFGYSVSRTGELVFGAILGGTGVDFTSNRSLWRRDAAGTTTLAYRTGDTAPGTSGETFVSTFDDPAINPAGEVAFVSRHSGGAGNGIWAESGTTLGLVAQTGDIAPGTGGATFATLGAPAIARNGDVAFLATLDGATASSDTALFVQRGGNLGLVAREGDAAPGLADVILRDTGSWGVTMSLSGVIAVRAEIEGNTSPGTAGLWVEAGGTLAPVLLPGDLIEVAPGDSRSLIDVRILQGSLTGVRTSDGGRPMTLHDDGELPLVATLSGNAQALVRVDTTP